MRAAAILLAAAALALPACSTMSWVNDISTSPDDKSVVAVGAQYRRNIFTGLTIEKPIRWFCIRGADDRLTCVYDVSRLPRM
jgi:hypothetical protein